MLAVGYISRFRLACLYLKFILSFYPPLFLFFFFNFLLPLITPLSFIVYFLQKIVFITISLLFSQLISFSSETI